MLVSPAWSVLPMGCSWSLYFAQSVTETIASRAALEGLSPLHDKTRDLFLGRREGVQAYCVCVDKPGVIANTQQESFPPQIRSELSQKVKSFGVELDGLSLCCRVSSKRFWSLRRALDEVVWCRTINGRALEIVIRSHQFRASRSQTCTLDTAHAPPVHACSLPLGHSPSGKTPGLNLLRCEVF